MRSSSSLPPLTRLSGALLAAVVLALSVSACGSSSDDDSGGANAAATSENAQDTARAKLLQCLKDQGIDDLPGAGGERPQGGGLMDRTDVQDALRGPCKEESEAMGTGFSAEDRAALDDARVKLTACLREQGIDVPDSTSGGGQGLGLDRDDPQLQAAFEACRDVVDSIDLPGRGG